MRICANYAFGLLIWTAINVLRLFGKVILVQILVFWFWFWFWFDCNFASDFSFGCDYDSVHAFDSDVRQVGSSQRGQLPEISQGLRLLELTSKVAIGITDELVAQHSFISSFQWSLAHAPDSWKTWNIKHPASKASTTVPIPQGGPQPKPRSRHTIGTYREGQWFFKLAKLVLQIQDFFIRNIVCIFRYVNDSIGIDRHIVVNEPRATLDSSLQGLDCWLIRKRSDENSSRYCRSRRNVSTLSKSSTASPKDSHKEIERRKIAVRTHGREAVCVLYLEKVGKWSSMARDMEVRDFSTLLKRKSSPIRSTSVMALRNIQGSALLWWVPIITKGWKKLENTFWQKNQMYCYHTPNDLIFKSQERFDF